MTKLLYKLLPLLAMLFMVAPAMLSHDKQAPAVSDNNRRKAQYYFLEAQNEKSHDRMDSYYDLVKKAHDLDPTCSTYSFYVGHGMITMENATRDLAQQALELMKEHFEAHPGDYYETLFYSDACMMMGNPGDGMRAIKTVCDHNPYRLELQARLAEAYARVGDYTASNETYDSIAATHGKSLAITNKKLVNYVTMNDSAGALQEMHSLLATAPDNADFNINMGSLMQQLGQRDSALYYLDRAQQVDPTNGTVYLAKAQYYKLNGDSAQYEQQIQQALVNENIEIDDKIALLITEVKQLIGSEDSTRRADKLFETLITQHPHETVIHEMYSEYLVYKKDYNGAAEQLQYALDINPTDAAGWHRLMIVQMMGENFSSAINSAEKALEYNPDSVELYRYIGPAYYQMKQYDKALECYKTAFLLADSLDYELMSELKGGMGDVYQELKDNTQAIACYEESLQLNPANVGIMNNYAYFLSIIEQDLDHAERLAALAVKEQPTNATFLDTYAWVFYKKKNYEMALLYIKSAVENDDDMSVDVLDHYGDILYANGLVDAAVDWWQKALELSPDNESIQQKIKNKSLTSQ